MQEIRVPSDRFDIHGFIDQILSFTATHISGNGEPFIPCVKGKIREIEYERQSGYGDYVSLLETGKTLFCAFTSVNAGGAIPAADGSTYELQDPWDELDEDEPERQPRGEAEKGEDPFWFGEESFLAFLVSQEDEEFTFQPAVFSMGMCLPPCPDSAEPVSDCGIFNQPMTEFIERFTDSPEKRRQR